MSRPRLFVGAAVFSSLAMFLHEVTGNGGLLTAAVTFAIVAAIAAQDTSAGKGPLR